MYAVIEKRCVEWRCLAILDSESDASKWRDRLLSDGRYVEICKINRSDILRVAERITAE